MTVNDREFTSGDLATRLGGALRGPSNVVVRGVATLDEARADDITFVLQSSYAPEWAGSRAAAALVGPKIADALAPDDRPLIVVDGLDAVLVDLIRLFAPEPSRPAVGTHASAVVAESASIDPSARIGPLVTIGERTVIGADVVLHTGVRVYDDVAIGAGSEVHANTVIRERCRIGERVILHQNASIGADGFGFVPRPDGQGLIKVPHVGTVVIEDDVEIGANSCVDRAKFGATVIETGVKIDNLVQIAHNCRVGAWSVIAGHVGIAGSVRIGRGVMMAGGSGAKDHVEIGDGAAIGAAAIVLKDVPAGERWFGYPAGPAQAALRQYAALRKLPGLIRQLPARDRSGD